MKEEDPKLLLQDPEKEPTAAFLRNVLAHHVYELMQALEKTLSSAGVDLEWRYYKDGKAWLGKATFKRKTMAWISAWEHCIKTSFYFTEKTRADVLGLNLNEELKTLFSIAKPVGKLLPLIVELKDETSLHDFIILLDYKKAA